MEMGAMAISVISLLVTEMGVTKIRTTDINQQQRAAMEMGVTDTMIRMKLIHHPREVVVGTNAMEILHTNDIKQKGVVAMDAVVQKHTNDIRIREVKDVLMEGVAAKDRRSSKATKISEDLGEREVAQMGDVDHQAVLTRDIKTLDHQVGVLMDDAEAVHQEIHFPLENRLVKVTAVLTRLVTVFRQVV